MTDSLKFGAHRPLPSRRRGYSQEATIDGHRIIIRTGEYRDGTLGEITIEMHKEGASLGAILKHFAESISIGLQRGVPLLTYVDAFVFTRFEPSGKVEGNSRLTYACSIVDYVARELAVHYLHRFDLAHIDPSELEDESPAPPTQSSITARWEDWYTGKK